MKATEIMKTFHQAIVRSVNDSLCYTTDYKVAEVSSLRTFCAGGESAGPCSGDSGIENNSCKIQ